MRTQHGNPDAVARVPRAAGIKAPAVDAGALVADAGPRPSEPLGPGEVLQLQRSAGNAAIARRLGRQRSPVIQRSKESEELLTKLATPRVGEGQAIDVQTQLVDALETLISQKTWTFDLVPDELKLGGVLIDRLPKADKSYMPSEDKQQRKGGIQGLFNQLVQAGDQRSPAAQFVSLDADPRGAKLGHRIGTDVKNAGLAPQVVENALKTMLDAEQFEYLRLAGLPNDDWKILVELHYIRARPKDMAGFHKDTQGQSLFVNLNYHVPGYKLRGPEYVLNPPRSKAHDELIYGTPEQEGTLPEEFTNDLTKTREALGQPTRIESAGTVKEFGYVAFVDEAIHHATPWFGNRYVTPSEFRAYLERKYPARFEAIVNADPEELARAGRKRGAAKKKGGYSELVEGDDLASFSKGDLTKWKKWRAMITTSEPKRYTRHDFAGTMQAGEFDRMLEDIGSQPDAERQKARAGGWYAASIPEAGLSPVKPENRPSLVRTASNAKLTKKWPGQLPEDVPRKFIRSWVRAVPADYADNLRGN